MSGDCVLFVTRKKSEDFLCGRTLEDIVWGVMRLSRPSEFELEKVWVDTMCSDRGV